MATKKRWEITDEIAIADALKCKTRTEFAENYSGSWRRLSKKGFKHLDAACAHMTGYTQWTTEKCVDVARTCKTRGEFKKHTGAYCHMSENKLHDLCYAHMGPPKTVGRKKKINTVQNNCSHDWVIRGRNQFGLISRCKTCQKVKTETKTTKDLIVDMIKKRIMN